MSRLKVIVVGLGAVGSATALSLARAGAEVLGIDRWHPPHRMGSTHGESRITRATAWEGAQYVPLVARAHTLWRELAAQTGRHYFDACGALFVGRPTDYFIEDSRKCADTCGLPYELLNREQVSQRVPSLQVPAAMMGFFDPGAGVLYPERIVGDQLHRARDLGAQFLFGAQMLEWGPRGDGVFVRTVGSELHADRLVLCTGAWMPEVLEPLGVSLTVERVSLHWFAERPGAPRRDVGNSPVLLVGDDHGEATAIFPVLDGQIKAAAHGSSSFTTAERVDRDIHERDVEPVRELLDAWLPNQAGEHRQSAVCLYTNTPDKHFILDRHPQYPQIVLGSPCNGFGFKFSSASGEILAALARDATPPIDPAPWRLSRFENA